MQYLIDVLSNLDLSTIIPILGGGYLMIKSLEVKFEKRFESIDKHLDSIELKINSLEMRVSSLEIKFDSLINRVSVLENKVDRMQDSINDIDRRLCRLEGAFSSKDCCMIKDSSQINKAE